MTRPSRTARVAAPSPRACAALALLALSLAACTTPSTHPSLAAAEARGGRPALLPMRRYVADVDRAGGFVLSPDGRRLSNVETVGLDVGLAVRDAGTGALIARHPIGNQGRDGGRRLWLGDGRHIAYTTDPIGDENDRIHVIDALDPTVPTWTVTPWPKARSAFAGRDPDGTRFRFVSNRRDPRVFDLYEADASTRTVRELARAEADTTGWLIDDTGAPVGRVRRLGAQGTDGHAVEWSGPGGAPRTLATVGPFDTWQVQRIDTRGRRAWVRSNVGRDRIELVEIDLDSGRETTIGAHDTVDVDAAVFAARQGPPLGWITTAGLPRLHVRDADAAATLAAIGARAQRDGLIDEPPVLVLPGSVSDDGRRWLVRASGPLDAAELLWDRDAGTVRRLDARGAAAADLRALSPWEPYAFAASDGRRIHGLVLRPRGVDGPVPTVVVIHGGPWARDRWEPARPEPLQMLANRGYAVLRVDYRGSAGYGREHLWAGARTYGDRLQRDIAEAVQWAIDAGVTDRDRIGLLGGSFGGYSVLMQLIAQPHPYRCGVSIVGVADWPRTVQAWPPYWGIRAWADRFFGRPDDAADRADMLRQSPIGALDRIVAPLLVVHGANDVRVLQQDSVDVVRALRDRGHPVTFLSFPDEGHSISKWRNRLALWREVEDTFAGCLGGRSAGFDLYEWMPMRMRRDPR